MKKNNFECSSCLYKYLKWQGLCHECGQYGTIIAASIKDNSLAPSKNKKPSLISSINTNSSMERIITNIHEFDRVVGGGLVLDSVTLLCGQPGVGKSTFLLELVIALSEFYLVLYISTEESEGQIKARFERLNKKKEQWFILQENDFYLIIKAIENVSPRVVILDSLQNVLVEENDFGNSIQKLRFFMHSLVNHAKKNGYVLLVTGHITKEGFLAGPKVLEHLVDTVLYLESFEQSNLRILRSTKNRFGSIDESGFFIMQSDGLRSYENPQEIFLENSLPAIGSALTWISEGSRPFLVEVQTLLNFTKSNTPQRVMYGVDSKQFLLLCAVLEKYLKIPLYQFDIFCKVVSNYKIKDPHIDLAITSSIVSSYQKKAAKKKILFHGEVNLSGNIVSKYDIPVSLDWKKYGIENVYKGQSNKIDYDKKNNAILHSIYEILKIFD